MLGRHLAGAGRGRRSAPPCGGAGGALWRGGTSRGPGSFGSGMGHRGLRPLGTWRCCLCDGWEGKGKGREAAVTGGLLGAVTLVLCSERAEALP